MHCEHHEAPTSTSIPPRDSSNMWNWIYTERRRHKFALRIDLSLNCGWPYSLLATLGFCGKPVATINVMKWERNRWSNCYSWKCLNLDKPKSQQQIFVANNRVFVDIFSIWYFILLSLSSSRYEMRLAWPGRQFIFGWKRVFCVLCCCCRLDCLLPHHHQPHLSKLDRIIAVFCFLAYRRWREAYRWFSINKNREKN